MSSSGSFLLNSSGSSAGSTGVSRNRIGKRFEAAWSARASRVKRTAVLSAAASIGWAVADALIVPYLLQLGCPVSQAGLVWVVNPVLGIVANPLLGMAVDRYGRTPFLLLLACISAFGLLGTAFIPPMFLSSSGGAAVATAFILFGITDLSHDLLVTPSRALTVDVATDGFSGAQANKARMTANSWATAGQSIGRLLGMGLAALPVQQALHPLDINIVHFQAVAAVVCVTYGLLLLIGVPAAKEKTLLAHQARARATAARRAAQHAPLPTTVLPLLNHQSPHVLMGGDTPPVGLEASPAPLSPAITPLTPLPPARQTLCEAIKEEAREYVNIPAEFRRLFFVHALGWLLINFQSFYFTTWVALEIEHGQPCTDGKPECQAFQRGIHWGTAALAAACVLALAIAPLLPRVNSKLGTGRTYKLAQILAVVMTAAPLVPFLQNIPGVMVVALLQGIHPVVHNSNSFQLAELVVGEGAAERRGQIMSTLNCAMVVSQIFVAVSGPICLASEHWLQPMAPGLIMPSGRASIAGAFGIMAGMAGLLYMLLLPRLKLRTAATPSIAKPVESESDSDQTTSPEPLPMRARPLLVSPTV